MPPTQTEDYTYYNVSVISDVTDPKCSSKVNQRASKIMRVWKEIPRNICYSLIDTDGLVVFPVDSSHPEVNQEVTISFRKLSNYATDFDPWDSNYRLIPTDTNVTIKLRGPQNTEINRCEPTVHS
jgi:hypothetical protein